VSTQAETVLAPVLEERKLTSDDKAFLTHLIKVSDTFYDQIKIADQKAAYIFTFMVAFLVTSGETRAVFDPARYQSGDWVVMFLSAVMASSVLVSLVAAILVVLPRKSAVGSSLYWNAWPANRPIFLQARERDDPAYLFDQYIMNVDALSAINRAKFAFVSWALRGLIVVVVSYCFLLGWGTRPIT
jgi:hypothetical protein